MTPDQVAKLEEAFAKNNKERFERYELDREAFVRDRTKAMAKQVIRPATSEKIRYLMRLTGELPDPRPAHVRRPVKRSSRRVGGETCLHVEIAGA